MISTLFSSLARVTLFWYGLGVLVLFLGDPDWAERMYSRLALYPFVPEIEMHGLGTAAEVQLGLLAYWTLPVLAVWALSLFVGIALAECRWRLAAYRQDQSMQPRGVFWDVSVPHYSLGTLPLATTPRLTDPPVQFADSPKPKADAAQVDVQGAMTEALKFLTPAERQLCEELLQMLWSDPEHYAGLGHGVGLLEHTLNVASEAAERCTAEFRMPLLAALAHDVGKLITFQPDGKGGWVRKGLHSRESARILVTLPGFQALPEMHQRALLLAVKYDHAPNKMPALRGEREASQLAKRVISALSHADRSATAAEKDRHLERLKPEDLLWQDFVDFLREAPVVQRGKKGAANQVNNPPDSPYLFIYEAPWRDAAVHRLPAEVAAALDLTRRDAGKLAKYTRILLERLRKEGLLVETHTVKNAAGEETELAVSESNPLWDIQSGTGEKAVVLRGIMVLRADALWKLVNYRLSVKSPFPVQILSPNADAEGRVQQAPEANRDTPRMPEVSDGLKLDDVSDAGVIAELGLTAAPAGEEGGEGAGRPKTRARGRFKPAPAAQAQDIFGLSDTPASKPAPSREPARNSIEEEAEASLAQPDPAEHSTDSALALVAALASAQQPEAPDSEASTQAPTEPAERLAEAEHLSISPPLSTEVVLPAAPTPEPAQGPVMPVELSRAERREGLAVADAAACARYHGLKVGDKYYTEHSGAVKQGLKQPGSKYKGDSKEKALDLSSTAPRRGRRRIVS